MNVNQTGEYKHKHYAVAKKGTVTRLRIDLCLTLSLFSLPSSWHQYSPGHDVAEIQPHTFSVSPGFWRADRSTPNLPRLSENEFRDNVRAMVNSGTDWQLITTFNEAGEGTMVEASDHWINDSSSAYGYYLDALHDIV